MNNYVITISRQFGSLGRSIAAELADKLGISFYDRDIVEAAAKRMGQSVSEISRIDEKAGFSIFRKRIEYRYGTYSISDELFSIEKNIIRDLAATESCIIVGRCADSILKDFSNKLSVYIYAPYDARLKNCTDILMMNKDDAVNAIREMDNARNKFQKKYCPEVKTVFDNKDIMLDSSSFGVSGSADLLYRIISEKFECKTDYILSTDKNGDENHGKITVSEASIRFKLTGREQMVLSILMAGKDNDMICRELNIKQSTLNKHILNIYRKMNINNRVQLFKMVKEFE